VEQINQSCAARLADFKRPRSVRIVESMPRAMETKVVKAELRRMLQAEAAQ
jgi:crotonobetaine/carnitine-CoA ligase